MKRFIYFLSFFLVVSCSKEVDQLDVIEVEGEPEIIDANLVYSTLNNYDAETISFATVVFISEDFRAETETDEQGYFQIEVPLSVQEGYVVIAKEKYDRQIIKYDKNNLIISKKLVLVDNDNINVINTNIDLDNLYEISGQLNDADGNPITGIEYQLFDLKSNSTETNESARFFTNSDGQFSIVGVIENDHESLIFKSRLPGDRCFTVLEQVIDMAQFPLVSLGNLLFEKIAEQNFNVSLNVDQCAASIKSKVYFPAQQGLSFVGEPVRDLSLPVCEDKSYELIYVGVEDDNGENFDGEFYKAAVPSTSYSLKPCTSEQFFFEISYGGDLKTLEDVVYDKALMKFVHTNTTADFNFVMEIDDSLTDMLNNSNYNGKRIDFTAFEKFEYENLIDPSQNFEFLGDVYMDNVRNTDDAISGIIMRVDQSMFQMKIRFRVQKV